MTKAADLKLEATGLKPSEAADKALLVRRVTFDLIGLPPTPAELDAFLADKSPHAYERVVDRLLNSPRYGLVPQPVSPSNPDGLPIGVSKTTVATPIKGWPAGDYAGDQCAEDYALQARLIPLVRHLQPPYAIAQARPDRGQRSVMDAQRENPKPQVNPPAIWNPGSIWVSRFMSRRSSIVDARRTP